MHVGTHFFAVWLWYFGRSPLGLFSERGDNAFVATLRHRFGTPTA